MNTTSKANVLAGFHKAHPVEFKGHWAIMNEGHVLGQGPTEQDAWWDAEGRILKLNGAWRDKEVEA